MDFVTCQYHSSLFDTRYPRFEWIYAASRRVVLGWLLEQSSSYVQSVESALQRYSLFIAGREVVLKIGKTYEVGPMLSTSVKRTNSSVNESMSNIQSCSTDY
jgi:hypothetical protein